MRKLWVRTSLIMVIVVLVIGILPSILSYPQRLNPGPKHDGERPPGLDLIQFDGDMPTEEEIENFRREVEYRFFWDFVERMVISAVIGACVGIILSWSLAVPLRKLEEGAKEISAGNLSIRVKESGAQEFRSLASAFNQMAEGLEKQDTLRRNLLADVTHELRHPAHLLQGNIRAILDGVYPMTEEEMTRLYDQTELLTTLVNDLHLTAQAEAGQLSMNFVDCDLTELIRSVVETFRPAAEQSGISLLNDLEEKIIFSLDKDRISQVLQNLITNALKHSSEGQEIFIQLAKDAERINLIITDQGEGIAQDQIPFVFDRFYRADSSRNREHSGSGLGLAISKAIVEAHGGQIFASSDGPGKGMTIRIEFPV